MHRADTAILRCLFLLWLAITVPVFAAPPVAPGTLPLAESERVYIATIEHRGATLNLKAFPAIRAAIRASDGAQLKKFFAPDFKGEWLEIPSEISWQAEPVTMRRAVKDSRSSPVQVAGDEFIKRVIAWRGPFKGDPKVELALMSLSPVQREKTDGAWKGNAALRMVGALSSGGEAELMAKVEFDLARVPDVDEIPAADAWISSLRVVEVQQGTAARPILTEVGKERGIDRALFQDNWTIKSIEQRPIVTGGVYLGDFDNDGLEDVLIPDVKSMFLFRAGQDRKFTDVTDQVGLPRLPGVANAAFADFDNDGFVDLLLDYRLFRNIEGKRFQEVTEQAGFRFGTATGFTLADYDKDGRVDLYVSRYYGQKPPRSSKNSWIDGPGGPGNQLWRNLGNFKFEEVSAKANATAGRRSCFTAAWLDANNDTWPDVYVINEFGGGVLLVNNGNGSFRELPLINDTGDFGSMGMAVADYDNDGNIDVYTCNMFSKAGRRVMENLSPGTYPPEIFAKMKRFVTGSEMYRNAGDLKFERIGKSLRVHAVGWAYGAAFLDLDNDGFLDLYGTAGFVSVNKEEPDG
jgi:VCBS repeat protein